MKRLTLGFNLLLVHLYPFTCTQDSRVRMALLSAKIQAMGTAEDAHLRLFGDPTFRFVPRRKMIQIQVRAPPANAPRQIALHHVARCARKKYSIREISDRLRKFFRDYLLLPATPSAAGSESGYTPRTGVDAPTGVLFLTHKIPQKTIELAMCSVM